MPFQSKSQARAAFGGFLGPKMKMAAPQWASETPDMRKLPVHKNRRKTMGRGMERKALLGQMKGGC